MVNAALNGELEDVEFEADPVFGIAVPRSVPGVPSTVLRPRETWSDVDAYDAQAAKLAKMFKDNFERFAEQVSDQVRAAAPK
jgi:phosphoenolpyruvate carboxykinase (ATP)